MKQIQILPLLLLLATGWSQPVQAEWKWRKVWKTSIWVAGSVSIGDVDSSWNRRELNAILANSQGRFGPKGAAIKLGAVAGTLSFEAWLIHRAKPESKLKLYKVFGVGNLAYSVTTAAVVIHNYNLAPQGR